MMKTIKIRFIEEHELGSPAKYYIEQKKWYGWKRLGESHGAGAGDSVWCEYTADSPEKLLSLVLDIYYHTTRKYIYIIEYPMIKIY